MIPQVNIYKLSGEQISSLEVLDGKDAAIVIFWKTTDRNSQDHISDMINAHQEILATKNVRLIGICIDGEGTISHILPYVMGNSWEMEMYADKNSDFKRAMNIVDTPSTIVLNTENQVVCQYVGYCTGTEGTIWR